MQRAEIFDLMAALKLYGMRAAYDEAVAERYLWHEFGDSMLFLPPTG